MLLRAIEAARIAVTDRTPVSALDGVTSANGSEPWCLRTWQTCPTCSRVATKPTGPTGSSANLSDPQDWPPVGDPGTRPAARSAGWEGRTVRGLSYAHGHHDFMVRTRAARIEADRGPRRGGRRSDGRDRAPCARVWARLRADRGPPNAGAAASQGLSSSQAHLSHLHPMRATLGSVLAVRTGW